MTRSSGVVVAPLPLLSRAAVAGDRSSVGGRQLLASESGYVAGTDMGPVDGPLRCRPVPNGLGFEVYLDIIGPQPGLSQNQRGLEVRSDEAWDSDLVVADA